MLLDDLEFRKIFSGSSIKRVGRDRFVRNVLIAVGNSNNQDLVKDILPLLQDNSELVRAMAVWALSEVLAKDDFEAQKKLYYNNENNIEQNKKMEIFAQEIMGIVYYLDKYKNVYNTEDIMKEIDNPKVIAKYEFKNNKYSIPSLGLV